MLKEFKEFAMRGNVVDLAVGLVIGAAFGAIVSSLVEDMLMPPLGMVLGRVNFTDLYVNLSGTTYPSLAAAKAAGAPVIGYGNFLNALIKFLIVAFALFLIVRWMNRIRASLEKPQDRAPDTRECPMCVSSIPARARRCPFCTSELQPA
jgi:large conductance mechanosensitive channel